MAQTLAGGLHAAAVAVAVYGAVCCFWALADNYRLQRVHVLQCALS